MNNLKTLIIGLAILLAISASASARTITVGHTTDADYWNIQDAINAANESDIIEVWSGVYSENIVISKSITLKSRDGTSMTMIYGGGKGSVIKVTADNVTISGFTISSNTIGGYSIYGIYLSTSSGSTISSNTITGVSGGSSSYADGYSGYGIYLSKSIGCTISNNTITGVSGGKSGKYDHGGSGYGIYLSTSSSCTISSNTISDVSGNTYYYDGYGYGIYISSSSVQNSIYHNNILRCSTKGGYDSSGLNTWDNGPTIGGNYWSDYHGTDKNGDGIGDTPYELRGSAGSKDSYPFMNESGWVNLTPDSITDSDSDGVPDVWDKCPNTPSGSAVDKNGCPVSVTIELKKGWNLIGWTSATTTDLESALKELDWSAIGTYDPEWKSYIKGYGGSLKTLETGKGYFILLNTSGKLTMR